jgi:uncharacterized membrane protein YcaP (DUF421 family)
MNIRFWPDSQEWAEIFLPKASIGELVIRTLAVFIVLLIVFRLVGKKEINQAAMTDLLMVLLISEIVQNSMVGKEDSVLGGLIPAFALVIAWYAINRMTAHSETATKIVEGMPTLMVADGKMLTDNMSKENFSREELFAALRGEGIQSLSEVRYAVMELDGKVSVIQQEKSDSDSANRNDDCDLWEEVIPEKK